MLDASLGLNFVHNEELHIPYKNMPIQYTVNYNGCKNDKFRLNFFLFIFAQNIDCGYTLELPQ